MSFSALPGAPIGPDIPRSDTEDAYDHIPALYELLPNGGWPGVIYAQVCVHNIKMAADRLEHPANLQRVPIIRRKEVFMRKLLMPLVLVTLALFCAPAVAGEADGHVNFFLGQKSLDSDDWDPADKQPEFGAIMSFGNSHWPVHIAVDVMTSAKEETIDDPFFGSSTLTAATIEGSFGARKIWNAGNTHPYVGGGIALISAAAEFEDFGMTVDASDTAVGPWVSGGIFWRLGSRFNLGFDVRWSSAEVDFDFGDLYVLPH